MSALQTAKKLLAPLLAICFIVGIGFVFGRILGGTHNRSKSTAPQGNKAPAQRIPVATIKATPIKTKVALVLSGIDVLIADNFAPLKNRRIGLVTNQTGISRDGRATIDVLAKAPGVKLVALFSPEHGVRGTTAAGQTIKSSRDKKTGLPIYSLYGSTRRPTSSMLKGIDTLVLDLQDIGSRSYTYISTMGECMAACAAQNKKFVVLDRPNLIGGNRVEGNIPAEKFQSFVGPFPIAYCHGLTIGELAKMVNMRGWVPGGKACELAVIKMSGYRRNLPFSRISLPWRATSPNIPDPDSPLFYAATGIIGELTAISIGVGTKTPFHLAGAPNISGEKLASEMNRRRLSGWSFSAAQWTPAKGVYQGQKCKGVLLRLTNSQTAELTRVNFELLDALRTVAPKLQLFGRSRDEDQMFDLVCGDSAPRHQFLAGQSGAKIWDDWNIESTRFQEMRRSYLLY